MANILAQKKELKRAEKHRKNAEREAALNEEEREEEDQRRAVRDFEMTQAGLDVTPKPSSNHNGSRWSSSTTRANENESPQPSATGSELVLARESGGTKRKFELDEDELESAARADKTRARKAIEDEKVT